MLEVYFLHRRPALLHCFCIFFNGGSAPWVMLLHYMHTRSHVFHCCLTFRPCIWKGETGYDECGFMLGVKMCISWKSALKYFCLISWQDEVMKYWCALNLVLCKKGGFFWMAWDKGGLEGGSLSLHQGGAVKQQCLPYLSLNDTFVSI